MNAFKHGLAAIEKRREESVTTEHEERVGGRSPKAHRRNLSPSRQILGGFSALLAIEEP
jgi:hypothetical protein